MMPKCHYLNPRTSFPPRKNEISFLARLELSKLATGINARLEIVTIDTKKSFALSVGPVAARDQPHYKIPKVTLGG